MTATPIDIFGAPAPDPEPPTFTKRERHKIHGALGMARWRQQRELDGTANAHTEKELAVLLWLLAEVGAICGHHLSERIDAANEVCVLELDHLGKCEGSLL